ncbi:hypothetical protein RBWH47_05038 [Rhodopirellula baltica WH47]|uniref:Uncharacterized protein n=1 Tax=Rhodopirellula baltica WH47 TaxID=991778 RepID=F2B0W8_RHOBT|nr:hypothetical protein RBWH47_05038 [Rhodopirellula baltica WH47]
MTMLCNRLGKAVGMIGRALMPRRTKEPAFRLLGLSIREFMVNC